VWDHLLIRGRLNLLDRSDCATACGEGKGADCDTRASSLAAECVIASSFCIVCIEHTYVQGWRGI
jgi:hypothetical protein